MDNIEYQEYICKNNQRIHESRKKRIRRKRQIRLQLLAAISFGFILMACGIRLTSVKPDRGQTLSVYVTSSLPDVKAQAPKNNASVLNEEETSAVYEEETSAVSEDIIPDKYYEEDIPLLYNRDHPIPADSIPEQVAVGYGNGREQFMETRAAAAFLDMSAAAQEEGLSLTPFSGYRTHQRQTANYNRSIQEYIDQGYSREEAVELTQEYQAIPGTSEHEMGLAMDIESIEETFEDTAVFDWLQKNAVKYGFIMRYAKDTFDITGVGYEPWHYRYVGSNHAAEIVREGVTLEEYVESLGKIHTDFSQRQ